MPPAPSRDQTKAQPMSISQLCQQNDSDDDLNNHSVKQELDQDPFDLNSNDYQQQHYNNSNNHYNNNQHRYSNSSDEFEEFDTTPRSSQQQQQPDPAEQLAAEVLGDMANAGARTSSSASTTSNSSFVAPTTPFISRMSSLPLVNSALKAYESGKQNSKVMKYGAEMVESSVKSLSKPVFDQLEKVYPAKSDAQALPSPTNSARSSNDIMRPDNNGPTTTTTNGAYYAYRSRGDSIDSTSSNTSSRPSFDVLRSRSTRHEEATLRQRSDSQSSQRSFQFPASANGYYPQQQQQQSQPPQQQQQVGSLSSAPSQQFSGWRGVVATVGTASAAGVAIFSEESMKSLKYCLQWLQYAVQHIDHQIGLLRQFLVSLASPSSSTAMVPSTAASTLASIKKEVVETLRKVINVVSRYAGACLPDQAKINVRQFILSMPVRWATLNNESVPSTPMGSPSLGPQSDRNPEQNAALSETSERATKVLVLAHESSDMLKSVASIFKDSVDKAENWMDKLRYVGMNPQNNSEGLPSWAPTGFPGTPAGGMPGGFPGGPVPGSNGLEQYSLRKSSTSSSISNGNGTGSPSRSLKSSPRMGGHEDSGTEEEEVVLGGMDDSEDERHHATGVHAPLKRSMGSNNSTQGNAVRRRKKRGESAEIVAGLGLSNTDAVPRPIKEEVM
ncbi:hypothetical protein BGX29_008538 [Mortierella sp. GBA35]|nr:hypothetical protein BGX29_008538 [Mortierella sp. GBA35]